VWRQCNTVEEVEKRGEIGARWLATDTVDSRRHPGQDGREDRVESCLVCRDLLVLLKWCVRSGEVEIVFLILLLNGMDDSTLES
jgi:hypothetical protein